MQFLWCLLWAAAVVLALIGGVLVNQRIEDQFELSARWALVTLLLIEYVIVVAGFSLWAGVLGFALF